MINFCCVCVYGEFLGRNRKFNLQILWKKMCFHIWYQYQMKCENEILCIWGCIMYVRVKLSSFQKLKIMFSDQYTESHINKIYVWAGIEKWFTYCCKRHFSKVDFAIWTRRSLQHGMSETQIYKKISVVCIRKLYFRFEM